MIRGNLTLRRLRSTIAFVTDAALTGSFSMLLMMLAARSGSIEEFGQLGFVLAVVTAQAALAKFGFATLVYGRTAVRAVGSRRLLGSAIVLVFVLGASFYGVTLLAIALTGNAMTTILYATAGLRLIGAVGLVMPQHAMARSAPGDYLPVRLLTILPSILATVCAFSLGWNLLIFSVIWGVEGILFAIFCALTLGRKHATWTRRNRYRSYVIKAAPIAVQSFFIIVYMRFDQLYVFWRFGDAALGLYSAAAKIAEAGNLVIGVLTLILTPSIIRQIRRYGQLNARTIIFLAILAGLTFILCIVVLLRGSILLTLIFGSEYASGFKILAIYIGSIPFVLYGSIGSRVLAAQGISTAQMWSGAVGALSNVLLSVIFGEIIGLEGIALATVLSYATSASIMWLGVNRRVANGKLMM